MDLDLGTEPINTEQVTVPVEEKITGLRIQLTSDQKWSQFVVDTTQRFVTISPGTVGQEDFAEMCSRVKAMIQTSQGASVIQAAKAALRKKPLALKTEVVIVTA